MLTNGMLLRENCLRYLPLNLLMKLALAMDGSSPEAFEDLRVNAKWEKFSKNVRDFIRLKREMQPELKPLALVLFLNPMHSTIHGCIRILGNY